MLHLQFFGETGELAATSFSHSSFLGETLECVRGKDGLGFGANGSFQWSKAVKALCLLAIKQKLKKNGNTTPAVLSGTRGSFAASLDNAIHKRCIWLQDLFGTDARGEMMACRIFRRSNPGLRRPGPVIISLNQRVLAGEQIRISLDGEVLSNREDLLSLMQKIDPGSLQIPSLKLINIG